MIKRRSLASCLRAAAALRPEAMFRRLGPAEGEVVAFAVDALDAIADRHAANWISDGYDEGDRIALVATPEPEALAAIAGASRAGLDVFLAPPGFDPPRLSARLSGAAARALAGPADFAGLALGDRLAETTALAAQPPRLALWGAPRPGAARLDGPPRQVRSEDTADGDGGLALIGIDRPIMLDSPRLYAAADDWAAIVGLRPGAKIVTLLSLASAGSLVCAGFAPLIAGADLVWLAPFSSWRFAEQLSAGAPAHLVAPDTVISDLGRSGLLTPVNIASLTIVLQGAFEPMFEHDLEPNRVLTIGADPGGEIRIERLAQAFGDEFD